MIHSKPYKVDQACERCVFGTGEHTDWCLLRDFGCGDEETLPMGRYRAGIHKLQEYYDIVNDTKIQAADTELVLAVLKPGRLPQAVGPVVSARVRKDGNRVVRFWQLVESATTA